MSVSEKIVGQTLFQAATTTKKRNTQKHPVICGDDVRSARLSRGSVLERGKGPLSLGGGVGGGFPAAYCLPANLF